MKHLKPCPLCGADSMFFYAHKINRVFYKTTVYCGKCSFKMEAIGYSRKESMQIAFDRWNADKIER